ncbi:MAG TPA: hypothetical protein ACFYD6_02250 [Candidatus Brocadiia bacterium]|nr:hypothetical protein [Candidatus Brocadiales bacterium]
MINEGEKQVRGTCFSRRKGRNPVVSEIERGIVIKIAGMWGV